MASKCDDIAHFLKSSITILEWAPRYSIEDWRGDLNAGVIVFILLVPQGMAYAVLAGMPPIYGLYCATVPLVIYAMFGTSRQISIAAFAIISLLVGTTLESLGAQQGTEYYISSAATLAFLSGIISTIMGFLKLGVLSNFLSQSVMNGFITACALIIITNSMKNIFGIPIPRCEYTVQTLLYLFGHLHEMNIASLVISTISIITLYSAKVWRQQNPMSSICSLPGKVMAFVANAASLIVVFFSTIASYCCIANGVVLPIIGNLPSGMQMPSVPNFGNVFTLLPGALVISVISFMSNWAIAVKFATLHQYSVDASQELIATGLANVGGSFFGAFPVAGGLARSSVNNDAGARTPLSGAISAVLMIVSLFFFTDSFYYIPSAVLGAIIDVSVISMVDVTAMKTAYRLNKKDFTTIMCTFLCTFFVGIAPGLLFGVVVSLILVLESSAFPHIAQLGFCRATSDTTSSTSNYGSLSASTPLLIDTDGAGAGGKEPGTVLSPMSDRLPWSGEETELRCGLFQDIATSPSAQVKLGAGRLVILQMQAASLFFANVPIFRKVMDKTLSDGMECTDNTDGLVDFEGPFEENAFRYDIFVLVVDVSGWNEIDLSGVNVLRDLSSNLQKKNKLSWKRLASSDRFPGSGVESPMAKDKLIEKPTVDEWLGVIFLSGGKPHVLDALARAGVLGGEPATSATPAQEKDSSALQLTTMQHFVSIADAVLAYHKLRRHRVVIPSAVETFPNRSSTVRSPMSCSKR